MLLFISTHNNDAPITVVLPTPIPAIHHPTPSRSYHQYQPPQQHYNTPTTYNFGYQVFDVNSYSNYGHKEARDGYVTSGEYRVALPDGRTQVVRYTADENGYRADVSYEGEAQYPPPHYRG